MADPYRQYADEFRREVERTLREQPPPSGDPLPTMRRALQDFESWLSREIPSREENVSSGDVHLDALRRELEDSRAQIEALKSGRSEREAAARESESDGLRAQALRLQHENEDLKRHLAALHAELGDTQGRNLRAQEGYEAAVLRLEQQNRLLADRIAEFSRDKQFLEGQLKLAAEQGRERDSALDEARAKALAHEHEASEARARTAELERALAGAEREKGALEAALRELRTQAAGLQERILRGRETLEADLSERRKALEAALAERRQTLEADLAERRQTLEAELAESRQALDKALAAAEETRNAAASELRRGLAEQRAQGEQQLRETASFLESKLREVERDSSARYEEVRSLHDTLARLLADEEAR